MPAVIFDFDGTIADSFSVTVAAYNHFAPWFGYTRVTEEAIERFRGQSMHAFLEAYHIRGVRALCLLIVVKLSLLSRMKDVKIHRGIPEMIRALRKRGITVAVLTSNLQANTETCLKRNGLYSDFTFVAARINLFAKDVALQWLAKKYALEPSQIFYVGDETRDIEAAKRAGMKSIGVSWGFQTREALERVKPDFVVEIPMDILQIISSH